MMKSITARYFAAALIALALTSGVALAKSHKYGTLEGKVIKADTKARTLLVAERTSNKLYLVNVPEGVTFKITFGLKMRLSEPGIDDVNRADRIKLRYIQPEAGQTARYDEASQAYVLTASN
jgi:hypothetical protein